MIALAHPRRRGGAPAVDPQRRLPLRDADGDVAVTVLFAPPPEDAEPDWFTRIRALAAELSALRRARTAASARAGKLPVPTPTRKDHHDAHPPSA